MYNRVVLPAALAVSLIVLSSFPVRADLLSGIGAIGESATDEYQFYTADPGDRSFARGWVEILAELRGLNFGAFTTEDRGSPRHQGYEYNWARTRATAWTSFDFTPMPGVIPEVDFRSFTELGQHTGLAQQVADGDVTLTSLYIGGNDFLQFMLAPPDDIEEALATFPIHMAAEVEGAVELIMGANPDVRMVLAAIHDIRELPFATQAALDAGVPEEQVEALLDGISLATQTYNDLLRGIAEGEERIAMADITAMLADVMEPETLMFAGLEIDRHTPGDEVHHFFLADGLHPSTIGQSFIANHFLEVINDAFGAGVPLLEESEIRAFAEAVIPEPGAIGLLGLGLFPLLARRRRRALAR